MSAVPGHRKRADTPRSVAIVTGVSFVIAGLPKFVAYRWEVGNFVGMGLPYPEAWVIAAGAIEIVGGALLIAGRFVVPACIALGITMLVAIYVSGIRQGTVIPSLTLAPALLATCVYLGIRRPRGHAGPAPGQGEARRKH